MNHKFLATICLFFLAVISHGQIKTNLTPLDLFDMEMISDPRISPDGTKIFYVRNFKDIMTDSDHSNLWMCTVDGKINHYGFEIHSFDKE